MSVEKENEYILDDYDLECVLRHVATVIERKMNSHDEGEIDLIQAFREGYEIINPGAFKEARG